MTKEYILEGLGCANCANQIETALAKTPGLTDVSVNFMTTTLKLNISDSYRGDIDQDIEKVVHRLEPDVVIVPKEGTKATSQKKALANETRKQIIVLSIGAALFALGMVLRTVVELHTYIEFGIFLVAYVILGGSVVLKAIKSIFKGQVFNENFLMSVATIGAFIIGDFAEAVAVMLFYQVGELFQSMAVRRSKKSIADLMDIRPDYANVLKDGATIRISPESVTIGQTIVVKPGEKVPLDGRVIEGESMLDTSALTGESVPRKAVIGDDVLSGCINKNGVLTIEVTKLFGESTVAKIIDLVENASSKKAPTENFITTFSRYYTPVVVGLAALLAIIPPLFFGGDWADWVHRGLIFLVISCPCALVISIPLGFFGGIGAASKKGILVKGGNYLEALNNLDTVVFDKTGTLTKGAFQVTSIHPTEEVSADEILELAAWAEVHSSHPIAQSIIAAYGKPIDSSKLASYEEIAGQGIRVLLQGKDVLVGNSVLMEEQKIAYQSPDSLIGTIVYVASEKRFLGSIVISDEVKPDSREAIAALKAKGVRQTVMLTGDNKAIAEAVAADIGIDRVYSELLPQDKVSQIELLEADKDPKGKLAFVGDGINDAPVLARADIGIAMGGLGSDAAIEAADVVLMTDEPSKLVEAINVAKKTKKIVWQNIIFALGVKGVFLILGAFGVASMWEAVFADVGVSIIAILNAMRVLKMK